MSNIVIKMLDPEQHYLLEEFCEEEKIAVPNPEFSKVVAAIDMDSQKVVGVVVCQMQIHTEPIWIKKEYQGDGLWQDMCDTLEGYLDVLAFTSGVNIGVYNQPTNAAAERICRMRGYDKSEKPLYTKVYTGDKFSKFKEDKEIEWPPPYLQQSE